ncbi:MAG: hypothetical protein ABS40_05395 [Agrobacterium sp. SCN 61-19]|nr:MAG: hypothetical protein ABS40_05395 [Agrobacterium sp. SCN 61-19]
MPPVSQKPSAMCSAAPALCPGRIVVAVERAAKHIRLDVEDDRPGVAEAALAEVAARGIHLVEGKVPGLGLAITSDILTAYGGAIVFSRGVTGAEG